MTRYLLQRADGAFFKHPDDTDLREWTDSPAAAHNWADIDAAAAAAFIWNHLKGDDVKVVPVSLATSGSTLLEVFTQQGLLE